MHKGWKAMADCLCSDQPPTSKEKYVMLSDDELGANCTDIQLPTPEPQPMPTQHQRCHHTCRSAEPLCQRKEDKDEGPDEGATATTRIE